MAKEEESKQAIELTQVATQMAPAYKLPTGDVVQAEELMLWIANEVHAIRKAVA